MLRCILQGSLSVPRIWTRESDTSSGGFTSGEDCLSSEEGESELSSVSERGTDESGVEECDNS